MLLLLAADTPRSFLLKNFTVNTKIYKQLKQPKQTDEVWKVKLTYHSLKNQ